MCIKVNLVEGRSNLANMTWLIAHEGGWDEVLLFLVPIVLAFLIVRLLERRSRAAKDLRDQDDSESQNTPR